MDEIKETEQVKQIQKKPIEAPDEIPSIAEMYKMAKGMHAAYMNRHVNQQTSKAAQLDAEVSALENEVNTTSKIVELQERKKALLAQVAKQSLQPINAPRFFPLFKFMDLKRKALKNGQEVIEGKGKVLFHYNDEQGERWYNAVPGGILKWRVMRISKEQFEQERLAM